jgi:hypothetical protein
MATKYIRVQLNKPNEKPDQKNKINELLNNIKSNSEYSPYIDIDTKIKRDDEYFLTWEISFEDGESTVARSALMRKLTKNLEGTDASVSPANKPM